MRSVLTAVFVLAFGTALPLMATAGDGRMLGDYRFIPTPQVRDPFITTHFRNATGVSIASGIDIPLLVVPTEPPDTLLRLEGNFVFIVIETEYQYAFNERVTLRGQFFGTSRVGTSGQSIISQGVTASWGLELGSTFALWRNDKTLVSAVADLRQGKVLVVDLIGYVTDIVDGNSLAPSLVTAEDRTTLLAGLAGARAINAWSGLSGFVQGGFSKGNVTEQNGLWAAGLSGSVDFGQRGQAPVGLLGSVAASEVPNVVSFAKDYITTFGLAVLYTGRDDLNVGAELKWSHIPLEFNDTNANPFTISGVFRYFF